MPRLIGLVDALTERAGELEADYLVRCAVDPSALRIKRADITDKLDVVPGSNINNSDVAELKRRARRRLAILNQVAAGRWPLNVRPPHWSMSDVGRLAPPARFRHHAGDAERQARRSLLRPCS